MVKFDYRKKVTALAVLCAALALAYAASIFFDPERSNARNASFSWMSEEASQAADAIEIIPPGGADNVGGTINLVRKNGEWHIRGAQDLPAKQGRVDDLFRILSERGAFPKQGSSAAALPDLKLTAESAVRLVIRGGASPEPLLNLLVGENNGREVFLRKNGETEFRSGNSLIGSYVDAPVSDWYDLKLLRSIETASVQRLRISPPGGAQFSVVRSGDSWQLAPAGGSAVKADTVKTDNYIRALLEAQAESFTDAQTAVEKQIAQIAVETGDGNIRTLRAGPAGEDGKWPVAVSGSPYGFLLNEWLAARLFTNEAAFK